MDRTPECCTLAPLPVTLDKTVRANDADKSRVRRRVRESMPRNENHCDIACHKSLSVWRYGEHGPCTWDPYGVRPSSRLLRPHFSFLLVLVSSHASFPSSWRPSFIEHPSPTRTLLLPRLPQSRSVMPVPSCCIFNQSISQPSVLLPDALRSRPGHRAPFFFNLLGPPSLSKRATGPPR